MKFKGLIIMLLVVMVLGQGIVFLLEGEPVLAEPMNLEKVGNIKEVPKDILNKIIDIPANVSIKIYDYFHSVIDSEVMGVSDEIWGTMAKLSGNGSSFEGLVRGITEKVKGKL